jgi:hypothetical protein
MGSRTLSFTLLAASLVSGSATAQTRATAAAPAERQLRESRYQLGQMERVLEGAVEHGANVIRERLQRMMPADMLLSEEARARGFRLDGYGVFFDVEVPSLEGTLPWSFRTLDQNNLGIDNALQTIRTFLAAAAANDVNVQQAMRRIELQVAPYAATTAQAEPANAAAAAPAFGTVRVASATADQPPPTMAQPPDPILNDPNEVYRSQIRDALIDAMLEHSRGLNIAPNETLTVAARRTDTRPRLTMVDTDARTVVLSLRGADLSAFLGGQITRDEARQRVEVRVF